MQSSPIFNGLSLRFVGVLIALALAIVASLATTFAWTSFSSHVVNEAIGGNVVPTLAVSKEVVDPDGAVPADARFGFTVTFSNDKWSELDGPHPFSILDDSGSLLSRESFMGNSGVLELTSGESAVFDDIPIFTEYSVVESYSVGFVSSSKNSSGKITPGGCKAEFTNTWKPSGISVTKSVANAGDGELSAEERDAALTAEQKSQMFPYEVRFYDGMEHHPVVMEGYGTDSVSVVPVDVHFRSVNKSDNADIDYVAANFQLRHGQTALFDLLDPNTHIEIMEAGYSYENDAHEIVDVEMPVDYKALVSNWSGRVVEGLVTDVTLDNLYKHDGDEGGLKVSQEVMRLDGYDLTKADKVEEFEFWLRLWDEGGSEITGKTDGDGNEIEPRTFQYYVYDSETDSFVFDVVGLPDFSLYSTSGWSPALTALASTRDGHVTKRVASGDAIVLKHGQAATIMGLPAGTAWELACDLDRDGYIAQWERLSGYIVGGEEAHAPFLSTVDTKLRAISGEKRWDFGALGAPWATLTPTADGYGKYLPSEVSVRMTPKNGVEGVSYEAFLASEDDGVWRYEITDVPIFDADGHEIDYASTYDIEEVLPGGDSSRWDWEATWDDDGFDLYNVYVPSSPSGPSDPDPVNPPGPTDPDNPPGPSDPTDPPGPPGPTDPSGPDDPGATTNPTDPGSIGGADEGPDQPSSPADRIVRRITRLLNTDDPIKNTAVMLAAMGFAIIFALAARNLRRKR